MPTTTTREVEHEITVAAPAADLHRIIAEVQNWPLIFGPTVHAEYLERAGGTERIQLWATANGTAKTWTSRRELAPGRVDFRQEVSQAPVGGMGGAWVIEALSGTRSRVRLLHDYHASTGDPADLEWIDRAVDRNSKAELEALKTVSERDHSAPELLMSFDDTVHIDGAARDVYDFINEAGQWPQRLAHVARVRLEEETPGLQLLEMDTSTKDGSTHTTKSVRVCRPHDKIVYKQTKVPALMTLHTGQWIIEDVDGGGASATSRHTVRINEANIAQILGAGAGVEDARDYVRKALSANSLATLGHAKDYAEKRS